MESVAYDQFLELENTHWWFLGRNAIFKHLVDRVIAPKLGGGLLRTLDLGCGMGGHLPFLTPHGPTVAVDMEPRCLRHCKDRGYPHVAAADGTRLPFVDGAFDLVTAFDTFEHIPDDAAAARECLRVLRPGGRLFVSGPAYRFLYSHQDRVVHHHRRYTTGSFGRVLRDAGFEVEKASYINFLLFPLILPAVLLLKLKERLRPPAPDAAYSNASVKVGRLANRALLGVFSFERRILARVSVPCGHSLILVARKPG
ncbi:MAG TPA: class I SAM-dependent methyltransferase [Planctomycetota bacterium]|nr:class I SAM-dependent methyltransferase [Planctomycetota bacterium]